MSRVADFDITGDLAANVAKVRAMGLPASEYRLLAFDLDSLAQEAEEYEYPDSGFTEDLRAAAALCRAEAYRLEQGIILPPEPGIQELVVCDG